MWRYALVISFVFTFWVFLDRAYTHVHTCPGCQYAVAAIAPFREQRLERRRARTALATVSGGTPGAQGTGLRSVSHRGPWLVVGLEAA